MGCARAFGLGKLRTIHLAFWICTRRPFFAGVVMNCSSPEALPSSPGPSPMQRPAHAYLGVSRYDTVDALRGLAMLWMTAFHFGFDLSHFGFWPQNFRADPFWTTQRTLIVSLFLFCAGMGQAIALQQGQGWHRFGRRWMQVVACAVLVSAGSFLMFPQSFIHFGVLHGLAVMLLIARCTAGWGAWLWLAGLVAWALPSMVGYLLAGAWADAAPVFNSRALNWLGLVSRKPYTEDYVPVFPWLGVLWWGLAIGQWILGCRNRWMLASLPRVAQPLAVLGRHSLSYYMLHQPIMLGALVAVTWIVGR
jgi:uncharacterized membrane protein